MNTYIYFVNFVRVPLKPVCQYSPNCKKMSYKSFSRNIAFATKNLGTAQINQDFLIAKCFPRGPDVAKDKKQTHTKALRKRKTKMARIYGVPIPTCTRQIFTHTSEGLPNNVNVDTRSVIRTVYTTSSWIIDT